MKFLLDANIETALIVFLRNLGFDVLAISELDPALKDAEILNIAFKEGLVLITNDKDFGELIFKNKLPHKGLILFRLNDESAKFKVKRMASLLESTRGKLQDKFVVVTEEKIRIS